MFRRRKEKQPGFEISKVGNVIIERVQTVDTLHELDGSKYQIIHWTLNLRVEDGPVLYEKSFATGTPEALEKLQRRLRPYTSVRDEYEARQLFYRGLYERFK